MGDKMDITTVKLDEKEKKKEEDKAMTSEEIKKSKIKQDFSAELDARLPQLKSLALENNKLHEAVDQLLVLEKQTRAGEDELSTIRVACFLVTLCFEANDFAALREALIHVSKRRGQSKDVIQKMVIEAMTFVEKITVHEKKMELIDTLRLITEGKIFVEIERARLTRILAKIKEDEGNISEAADILQEVQVETYGAMDPREKIDFILEQMRLCLAKNDNIRAQIISKKITTKALDNPDFQDLKLRFYELMIRYYHHNNDYLSVCKSYRSMYDTKIVQEDTNKWQLLLKYIVVNIVLARRDNEQSDLIHKINLDKKLVELPDYQALLKLFITRTLIRWPAFEAAYAAKLNGLEIFQHGLGKDLWKHLHSRVVEHNIGVMAEYYQRVKSARLAQLLDLSEAETEKYISEMVSSGSVWAKIDRPKGIVTFRKRQEPNDQLNDWSHNINELLGLLEKTCHLIHRENMVHNVNSH